MAKRKRRQCPTCGRRMRSVDGDGYDLECSCGHILASWLEQQLEAAGLPDEIEPQGLAAKVVREEAADSVRRIMDIVLDDGKDKTQVFARLRALRRHPPKVSSVSPEMLESLTQEIERTF